MSKPKSTEISMLVDYFISDKIFSLTYVTSQFFKN
jgi:hypothetical protein